MNLPSPCRDARASTRSRWIRTLLLGSVLAACVGGALVHRPDLLVVERVDFQGNQRASDASLRHLSDVRNGTAPWAVDLDATARGVERHPWVRSAVARRAWPDRVVVEVEEHRPVALLAHDGLWYVDREGRVFLRARSDDLDYPVITGVDPGMRQVHPALPVLALADALELLEALDSRGLVPRDRVSELRFSDTLGFTAYLVDGPRIAFGLSGHDRQLDRLTVLLEGHLELEGEVLVDLAPARVAIVRPVQARPEPVATPPSTPPHTLENPTETRRNP